MDWHKELWTYLIVTAVAVLIWLWSAGETREVKRIEFARMQFTVPESQNWVITPNQVPLSVIVDGSKLANQRAETLCRQPVRIAISAVSGRQTVYLLERLRQHDGLRSTGVAIRAVEPTSVELDLDPVERMTARVKASLPGVQPEGDVVIEPAEVSVAMPARMRQRFPQSLFVEAFVDRSDLDRLKPGIRQTLDANLRLPEGLPSGSDVTIAPSKVSMSFVIRSRTREIKLDSVRVQLAGPPEDRDAYAVAVDPKQLRDVVVTADADLIRRIESNEVTVVAILHLSSREKESRIDSKKITAFMTLVPEAGGSTRGVQVQAKVGDSNEMPTVKLRITDRAAE